MTWTDEEKLQLRKMLASEWWKVLESIVEKKIQEYKEQIDYSAKDYRKVRDKVYDELNIQWALIRWMSLVLKAPYDILNEEAKNNIIEKMNEHWRNEVKKLER